MILMAKRFYPGQNLKCFWHTASYTLRKVVWNIYFVHITEIQPLLPVKIPQTRKLQVYIKLKGKLATRTCGLQASCVNLFTVYY